MRGKVCGAYRTETKSGITPAYAGKRQEQPSANEIIQDHPRLCGEKCGVKVLSATERRITPAYAGKSSNQSVPLFKPQDHPRLCGEKDKAYWWQIIQLGSPPPMRGKVRCHFPTCPQSRITPAYAGKSAVHSVTPDTV